MESIGVHNTGIGKGQRNAFLSPVDTRFTSKGEIEETLIITFRASGYSSSLSLEHREAMSSPSEGSSAAVRTTLLFLLIALHLGSSLASMSPPPPPLDGLLEEMSLSISGGLKKIQFRGANMLYTQLRDNVLQSDFPIDLFADPRGLPRIVKNAEQLASTVSFTAERVASFWENSSKLWKPIAEGKIIWASLEIEEMKHYLKTISPAEIRLCNRNLTDVLTAGYQPRAPIERLYAQWRESLLPVAFIAFAVLVPLELLPLRWMSMKKRTAILIAIGLAFLALIIGFSAWRLLGPTLFGPNVYVRQSQEIVNSLVQHAKLFEEGHNQLLDALQYFEDYCTHRMGINETISVMMSDFHKRIGDALTDSHGSMVTRPEVVLEIVQSTQQALRQHKLALSKLALSREQHSPSARVKLDPLIELVDSVQGLFASLEVNIYANLKAGLHTTDVIITHLINVQGLVDDGKLQDCSQFLAALQNYQSRQMVDLKDSNNYISVLNDKVSELRLENTRLRPHFSNEEFVSMVMKWASRAGMITSSAPLLSALALPATAAVPALAVGAAVAVIGYNWQALYENAEGDAKVIVSELQKLDKVLQVIESGLSEHEVTLANLINSVQTTLTSVSFSQKRFRAIMAGKVYTEEEAKQLKLGLGRVMDSMSALRDQYSNAESRLYGKLKARATLTEIADK